MRIIALGRLRDFWTRHPQAELPLRNWYAEASRADWKTPEDIKRAYRSASFLDGNRVVFNIKGNDFRLVVAVHSRVGDEVIFEIEQGSDGRRRAANAAIKGVLSLAPAQPFSRPSSAQTKRQMPNTANPHAGSRSDRRFP